MELKKKDPKESKLLGCTMLSTSVDIADLDTMTIPLDMDTWQPTEDRTCIRDATQGLCLILS